MFWQVLRPFVPAGPQFDQSFAETFAIPEFRTLEDGAARDHAVRKALYTLADFKDISEATATRVLSNNLLFEQLRTATDDKHVQEQVELAVARDNELLIEEKNALNQELRERIADNERQSSSFTADLEAVREREVEITKERDARIETLTQVQSQLQAKVGELEKAHADMVAYERASKERQLTRIRVDAEHAAWRIGLAVTEVLITVLSLPTLLTAAIPIANWALHIIVVVIAFAAAWLSMWAAVLGTPVARLIKRGQHKLANRIEKRRLSLARLEDDYHEQSGNFDALRTGA
jgi:hypothetical protein